LARVGLGGPVGFFLASLGFSASVIVARVWENVAHETHCVPACPSFTLQAFRLHHFYYGVGFLIVSITVLAFASRQRVRWDAALVLGIGMGLLGDEAGLLLLRVPYSSPISLILLAGFATSLFLGAIHAALRDGTWEFHVLDQADALTATSALLAMFGILYLDRPLQPIVEAAGLLSWISALVLLALFGKRHFLRVLARVP